MLCCQRWPKQVGVFCQCAQLFCQGIGDKEKKFPNSLQEDDDRPDSKMDEASGESFLNGSYTLAKFVSKIVGDFMPWNYLPWPPWVA